MTDLLLDALDTVNSNAARLIGSVATEQWHASTPCAAWDVGDLVTHMIGTNLGLAASAERRPPSDAPMADHAPDELLDAFTRAAERSSRAWRADAALEGEVATPFPMPATICLGINVIDIGTHCWDLAQAVGVDHGLSAETIGVIDDWNRRVITDEVRTSGAFAPSVDPDANDALTTMLAFTGRRA